MITNLGAGLLIAVVMWPLAQLQGLEEVDDGVPRLFGGACNVCVCVW